MRWHDILREFRIVAIHWSPKPITNVRSIQLLPALPLLEGNTMYTLKVITAYDQPIKLNYIYDFDSGDVDNSAPLESVNECETYTEVPGHVNLNYHFEGYNPDSKKGHVCTVTFNDQYIFIYRNQSAYLMNQMGQTVKIINKAH